MRKPMLHIVFGESAAGTLRLALRQAGRDDTVSSFYDNLSFGPINPPVAIERAAWTRTDLYFPEEAAAALDDTLDQFWHMARLAQKRVVWFSRRSVSDFCGFLELVSQMGRKSYQVVDLTRLEIAYRTREGETENRTIFTLAELSPDQVRENALWDRSVPLSGDERRRYRRYWQRLRRENAPFRVVDGDAVISTSIELYDNMLLSRLTAEWSRAACIIADAIAGSLGDTRYQVGDLVLFGRLRKLIDAGRLDARGDFATMRGTEVRLPHR